MCSLEGKELTLSDHCLLDDMEQKLNICLLSNYECTTGEKVVTSPVTCLKNDSSFS